MSSTLPTCSTCVYHAVSTTYCECDQRENDNQRHTTCSHTPCHHYLPNLHHTTTKIGETTEDGMFSIEETRCVGACGLAPVFTVNGEVYGKATVQKLDQVLDELSNKE